MKPATVYRRETKIIRIDKTFSPLAFTCILVGILLILENYSLILGISKWWPIFPLLIGIGMGHLFVVRGLGDLVMIGMATYLVSVSIFFFYLNIVGWLRLKELWPVFIGLLGLSFLSVVAFGGGRRIYYFLSFFLIVLSIFFFVIFTVDTRLWPLSLILFGLSILIVTQGEFS
ncbi:hypothetical protein ACFL27_12880 [candidate division CSSED10-310 bacterium]|uniref:DUF5668 domain-containing protein n=1 Tax=candidate division CSSED10-310 bacterium TaxID=2855610 RepID=A0ABV6YY07_UNCC1